MKKCSFSLIGAGYRAAYFARVAAALPERFELRGVLGQDPGRAEAFAARHGLRRCADLDELLRLNADFVVVCVSRGQATGYLMALMERGVPALCETPPGETREDLVRLWEEASRRQAKIDVAEQYFLQPLYAAWYEAVRQGMIGPVENISLSALHGYHGVSIIRRFLGVGMESCRIHGERHQFSAVRTSARDGVKRDGEITPYQRDRLSLAFESGKVGYFDFAGIQYHSFIRTRQINVQGQRGEIDDLEIRCLAEDNLPVFMPLSRHDRGRYDGVQHALHHLTLGERLLYANPFPDARLNDDELAIASCLDGMRGYLETGKPFYGLADALQDTYLSQLMDQALAQPHQEIISERMPWAER